MDATPDDKTRIEVLEAELEALRLELAAARAGAPDIQDLLREIAERRRREGALARSEARFRALVAATTAAVWMCDAQGEIVEDCPSWAAFTGQTFEAYRGRGWLSAVHPADAARAAAAWAGAVTEEVPYEVAYRLRRADGAWRVTLARGAPVRDEAGRVRGWIGANLDISAQEQASVELRDREERLRAALAGSGAGTFRWDITTNSLEWDTELDRIFGLPPGETTRSLEGFIAQVHPDDRAMVVAACERCAAEGVNFEETFRVIWPDGSVRWIFDRGRTYHDADGRPAYMTGACIDVTERQAATARLRESEERLRIAQEAGAVGAFDWFPETGEVIGSEHYHRLWGLPPGGSLKAEQLMALMHPDDRPQSAPANLDRLGSALDYAEYRVRRADTGEWRWLARRGQVLPAEPGVPARVVGVAYDVTDRRLAEERLQDVLESVTDGFVGVDAGWRITLTNGAARRHLGVRKGELVGRLFWEAFADIVGSPIESALRRAMEEGEPLTVETASVRRPGRFLELRIAPKTRGGLAIAFTDVTVRHRAERHRDLLVNELNHRVKNSLAIVQGAAHQTLRRGVVPDEVRESFAGRLDALARAHDILTRSNWDAAYLHELVGTALAPFIQGMEERVRLDGPEMRLPARTAVAFALSMHELATNAVKYGALSMDGGEISVAWRLARVDDEPWLKLRWVERGGPPVRPPQGRGFGSRMIETALSRELGGRASLQFDPEGLCCIIEAPLRHLEDMKVPALELDA